MKQPQLLTLQNMFDVLRRENNIPKMSFYDGGLGVVVNMRNFLRPFISDTPCPYLLEDYRMGYIRRGRMRSVINLQEYTATAGQAVFVTPGSIVEPLEVSDDFLIVGMGVRNDLFHLVHQGGLPPLFDGRQKFGVVTLAETDRVLLDRMIRMLCETVMAQKSVTDCVCHLVAAVTSYYSPLFAGCAAGEEAGGTARRVFERFLQLVNQHCREQRGMAFYADKLCLTERYMGTVVRQASGVTAKEWIDRAVITAAKVMLRHGNLQVAEIAEQLHFASPSFFCKYFKRLTGCTPQEYRQGGEIFSEKSARTI